MATLMTQYVMGKFRELRFQPTAKRIRVFADGETVADTTRAVLVWEPKRVTPQYAVPAADLQADLVDAARDEDAREVRVVISAGGPSVVDPRSSFGFHTDRWSAANHPHCARRPGRRRLSTCRLGPRRPRGARLRRLRLARGGGTSRRASTGSVSPHRCASKLPSRARRVGWRGACGVRASPDPVRDDAAGALLPPARGCSIRPAHPDR